VRPWYMLSEWADDELKRAETAVMMSFPRLAASEVIDAIAAAAETIRVPEGVRALADRAIAVVAARKANSATPAK
jgi:hypothetical protein